MANQLLTPSIIAKEALIQLRKNAVMSNLVYRDYSNEFVAGVGDTITVRKPNTFEAKEFNADDGIEVQDVVEAGVPVKMDKHLDVSFAVTSKDMTLSIEDFSAQFLVPAMQAFADKVDKYLLALEKDITARTPHTADAITKADVIAVRKALTDNAVPLTNRSIVYGADAEADLLNTDLFISADKVGDDGTALREASLGRKFGLDFYVDQNVEKVEVEGEEGADLSYVPTIAFHKNAFALVTRPLALPMGTTNASIETYDGFGLRVVYGYDQNTKTDTISIDMLCGVKTLDERLASVLEDQRVRTA